MSTLRDFTQTLVGTKIKTWQTVVITLITSIASIITTYITTPPKPPSVAQMQGLDSLSSIEGKWKYICTDYNHNYQHGGTFIVEKKDDGSYFLNGQRKWKDIFDTVHHQWNCKNFPNDQILNWSSTWIYVHNSNQFNMEYEIDADGNVIKGYCTGIILKNDSKKVSAITGYFYQLLPRTPLLAGQILFTKISDDEFLNPNYNKNHQCSQ